MFATFALLAIVALVTAFVTRRRAVSRPTFHTVDSFLAILRSTGEKVLILGYRGTDWRYQTIDAVMGWADEMDVYAIGDDTIMVDDDYEGPLGIIDGRLYRLTYDAMLPTWLPVANPEEVRWAGARDLAIARANGN